MNKSTLLLATWLLAACSNAAPTDTAEFLMAHPDQLREIDKACRDDYAKTGAAECDAAAEARRRLFIGKGPQYTPPKESPKF